MIEDGVTGLLVPPHDPAALAAAIVRLLTDHPFADMLGRAGHDLVHDRFCVELMVARGRGDLRRGRPRRPADPRSPPPADHRDHRRGAAAHRGALASAPMSLPRFWAFLAVALPVARGAHREPVVGRPRPTTCAPAPRSSASSTIPRADTWTYTAAGQPWFDQQWGAQVAPVGGLPARRLDRPRAPARRRSSGSSSAACSSSAARPGSTNRGARPADPRRPSCRRGGARRSARSCSGWPLRAGPARCSRVGGTIPRRLLGDPAHRPRLGEPPRQLLPRSARRRAGLDRGRARPRRRQPHGCC